MANFGNMAKQQFCSSHGALTFAGCIGRSATCIVGPVQSEELPRWAQQNYAILWHTTLRRGVLARRAVAGSHSG